MMANTVLRANPVQLLHSLPLKKKAEDYDGGLRVSRELQNVLDQAGYLENDKGGKEAREMYVDGTATLDAGRLSPFGLLCFMGAFEHVVKAVETGVAPPLSSTETPYKLSYATIIVFGAQGMMANNLSFILHLETLQYLISKNLPLDTPDIVGWTALSHAAGAPHPRPRLAKVLIDGGANTDHKSRFGDVPLIGAFMRSNVKEADLLLERGADLDIADADGMSPRKLYITTGPEIAAIVQKHILRRSGQQEAPRSEKSCDHCKKTGVSLKNCSKCRVARYCSIECQRAAWKSHKEICQPFGGSNTLTFKPLYNSGDMHLNLVPLAQVVRQRLGGAHEPVPKRHTRGAHIPKTLSPGESKQLVIKVQAAVGGTMPMLVYDKKRDFVCRIARSDSPANYDKLSAAIREKGVFGLKAYFMAELKGKDELVIKISEVLAEQPF